jgi:hypothetical protein
VVSRTGLSLAVPFRSQNGLRYSLLENKESLIVLAPAWAPARPTPRPKPQSVSCRARAVSYNFCPGPVYSLGPPTRFSVHHGSVHAHLTRRVVLRHDTHRRVGRKGRDRNATENWSLLPGRSRHAASQSQLERGVRRSSLGNNHLSL